MKDKVFIDTNVLIYAYSETEPDKKDTTLTILENYHTHDSIHLVKDYSSSLTKFPSACSVYCPQRGAAVGREA
jgi:transposase